MTILEELAAAVRIKDRQPDRIRASNVIIFKDIEIAACVEFPASEVRCVENPQVHPGQVFFLFAGSSPGSEDWQNFISKLPLNRLYYAIPDARPA